MKIKDLINFQGEPINRWVNLFKLPATQEIKENYAGRIRMKIAAANTDQKKLVEAISNSKLLKTKIFSKNKISRSNSMSVENGKKLINDVKMDKKEKEQQDHHGHGDKDDLDSLKTDSS